MDEFWWALLFITFYIPFMFLWGFTLVDVILRKDLHAGRKILWALVILFIPLFGVIAYFITRPKNYDAMSRGTDGYVAADYSQASFAGPTPSAGETSDMAALSHMHDVGVISHSEFESIRGRVAPAT